MPPTDVEQNFLFGLLALQNGLVEQKGLVAAFQAWTRNKTKPIAEYLVERGDLDHADRVVLEALVGRHIEKHGGEAAASLAIIDGRKLDPRQPDTNRRRRT